MFSSKGERKKCGILLLICFGLFGCHLHHIPADRAFYYWKSNFNLTPRDTTYLGNLQVKKIYLHLFDVAWNETVRKVLPVDEISFSCSPPKNYLYVPVIYISTEALAKTGEDEIIALADHIIKETKHIDSINHLNYHELLIDCDWTESTQTKYFSLLSYIKRDQKSQGKTISVTIRLHQIKYAKKTGIPPVDRGVLMFYNMGKINADPGYNSIYNDADAEKYASYISNYSLPLDLALPIFSWTIQVRQGKIIDLFQKTDAGEYQDTTFFQNKKNNTFVSKSSFFLHGKYFMKGDLLKVEDASPDITMDAESEAMKYLKDEKRTISLFEYDSLYISHYEKNDIEKIFSSTY